MNSIERKVDIRILEAKLEIRGLLGKDMKNLTPYRSEQESIASRLAAQSSYAQQMSGLQPSMAGCGLKISQYPQSNSASDFFGGLFW